MTARLHEATDPVTYGAQLREILNQIGQLTGEAETAMIELLDDARAEIRRQLLDLDLDSPTRALLERARSGVEQTMANLADDMGTTLADLQDQGHALGIDLALKPLGGRGGIEAVAAGVTLDQLQIVQRFSAELIQDIPAQALKRINGEIAAVVIGAKSPFSAATAIGKNLTDRNHFSTIAHRARAIVVTEVGRAHALGSQNAQTALARSLAEAGDPTEVRKRWLNAHLPGARATHLAAEARYAPGGTVGPIPHNHFYEIAGIDAYYPRDPNLPASESVHCHCVSVTVIDDGSAAAVGSPDATAPAKAAYTTGKAEKAAKAEEKTKKVPSEAATFLGDPYTAAGLNPVKSLKTGGAGYGGQIMTKKLGYATPQQSGFVWSKTLGAWKHPKAPAGKQLPDFKALAPAEQLALMKAAGISPAASKQIIKQLDIDTTPPKVPPTKPSLDPPDPPKPKPPPPPPVVRTPPPATPPAGSLPALRPIGKVGQTSKPAMRRGNYTERIKAITGLPDATPTSMAARTRVKESAMREVGARLEQRLETALGREEALRILAEMAPQIDRGSFGAANLYEEVTTKLIGNWAATSGDRHRWALLVQRRAARKFDLPWPPVGYDLDVHDTFNNYLPGSERFRNKTMREVIDIMEQDYGEVIDHFLDAMYEETQAELDRLFPNQTSIRMVRGMHTSLPAGNVLNVTDVMLNPLSSFSINTTVSKRFGRTLLYTEVPKERILGCATAGYGCLNEYEFIVIGARNPEQISFILK